MSFCYTSINTRSTKRQLKDPQWNILASQKEWETFVYSSAGKLKLILLFIQNKLKFNFKQKTFTLTYEITLSLYRTTRHVWITRANFLFSAWHTSVLFSHFHRLFFVLQHPFSHYCNHSLQYILINEPNMFLINDKLDHPLSINSKKDRQTIIRQIMSIFISIYMLCDY